jgi:hypothetical protein
VLELQEVLAGTGELRSERPTVALAQAFDLLGQVFAVETWSGAARRLPPQQPCLLLRPGDEVALVQALPFRQVPLGLRHGHLAAQSELSPSAR